LRWLDELSAEHRLPYAKASIRQQRTRWGSCSRHGTISLNARLLFLPPVLVDYVLLHELCHTKELNHSPRFWALLGSQDPECEAHRKALRKARAVIPAWLDHDLAEPEL
jgi:predicted metal-dependent hydrolase